MSRNPPEGVSVGLGDDANLFKWEILLIGPPDTLYEGGFFKALLEFPSDFPNMPPKMTFISQMWHPNGNFYSHFFASCALLICESSVSQWCSLYLNPSPTW